MEVASEAIESAVLPLPVREVCLALDLPRSTFYYEPAPCLVLAQPPQNFLCVAERAEVLAVVNSERFRDDSPHVIVARLADEDQQYMCSASTIYRILRTEDLVRERRPQRKHPHYVKPVLLATAINQKWSWDISKLYGPRKHVFYNAYVVLDLFSRYITGWMIADIESGDLAHQLLKTTCAAWQIRRDTLTVHADNGSPMKAKTLYQLFEDLGVAKSHSRPHVSNDNPFSESLFKTTKYHHTYPARFTSIEHARAWMAVFVAWYNNQHHHSGLVMMTPADVHFGRAHARLAARQLVMNQAFAQHPARFTSGPSIVDALPDQVWLNPPIQEVNPRLLVLRP